MIQIAFIGAGRMASAMVEGLLQQKHFTPEQIGCTCGNDPSGAELSARTGIRYFEDASALLAQADTVVLACKPQQLDDLGSELPTATQGRLVISILAGTTLKRLAEKFPQARNIVRAMPNTPGQIGAGVSAWASQAQVTSQDAQRVEQVLGSMGEVLALPEAQIDAVTAISGSGPAYVFEFTAALIEAGQKVGLSAEVAAILAKQTVLGAAKLMLHSPETPDTLRDWVTSKGGTTQAALESFAADGLRATVEKAVTAARDRSLALGG